VDNAEHAGWHMTQQAPASAGGSVCAAAAPNSAAALLVYLVPGSNQAHRGVAIVGVCTVAKAGACRQGGYGACGVLDVAASAACLQLGGCHSDQANGSLPSSLIPQMQLLVGLCRWRLPHATWATRTCWGHHNFHFRPPHGFDVGQGGGRGQEQHWEE